MATRSTGRETPATTSKSKTTAPRRATPAQGTETATGGEKTAGRAKIVPVPAPPPAPRVVAVATPVVSTPELRKKELIDTVVERSGIKKKDAKPVIEAMLAVLGETVAGGRELNLQPLGKLKINRTEEKANARVIACRLRQSLSVGPDVAEPAAANPLADAKE